MKKGKIITSLFLVVTFILVGCKKNNIHPSSFNNSNINVNSNYNGSFNSINFPYINSNSKLNYAQAYLESINNLQFFRDEIKEQYKSIGSDEFIEELNTCYWKEYSRIITLTQSQLTNESIRAQFVDELGELEVRYIESIDTSKMFINREIPILEYDEYIASGNKIIDDIKMKAPHTQVIPAFYIFAENFKKSIEASRIIDLYSYLYIDNTEYSELNLKSNNALTELENMYKVIFKDILLSDEYKDEAIKSFKLTEEEIAGFISNKTYDEELIKLFKDENELINTYYSSSVADRKDIYLSLITLRKQISKKLGYESYLDYAYKDIYERDYTYRDVENLIENATSSSILASKYRTTKTPSIYRERKIGIDDLLDSLEKVSTVVPSSRSVLKDLRTYGNFSFEKRSNKFDNSFECELTTTGDYFMFIGANGNINDFRSTFHEYGHYLSSVLNYKRNYETELDIAEIQSQALSLLMSNYYSSFAESEEVKYLITRNLVDALWSIFSSALISEFEIYVYTHDITTTKEIDDKFDELSNNYIYPKSFGYSGYTSVSHIYEVPGYYVSYLISIIPALEIWSEVKIQDGIDKYNKILTPNRKGIINVIQDANIYSPFSKEAIKMIEKRIEQIA